jgi:hypothetical protein
MYSSAQFHLAGRKDADQANGRAFRKARSRPSFAILTCPAQFIELRFCAQVNSILRLMPVVCGLRIHGLSRKMRRIDHAFSSSFIHIDRRWSHPVDDKSVHSHGEFHQIYFERGRGDLCCRVAAECIRIAPQSHPDTRRVESATGERTLTQDSERSDGAAVSSSSHILELTAIPLFGVC